VGWARDQKPKPKPAKPVTDFFFSQKFIYLFFYGFEKCGG
jgi:hypothetical protein